jgi:hypothetical protein
MRLPVVGDPVIHLSKKPRPSGWQIEGVSVVIRECEERKEPKTGKDRYVIKLNDYIDVPAVNLGSMLFEADAEIRREIDKLKKMPFPVYSRS